jgi:hypothetical protein
VEEVKYMKLIREHLKNLMKRKKKERLFLTG